jgi:exonuclease SbcD
METFDTSPEADSVKTDEQQTTLQQLRQRFSQILSEVEHQRMDV